MEIYQKVIDDGKNKVMLAANALRLEDLIRHSEEIKFAKRIGVLILGDKPDEKLKASLGGRIIDLQKMQAELSPDRYLKPGYGIPLEGEFDSVPQDKINGVNQKTKEYGEELKSIIIEYFPNEINELQNTANNRLSLLQIISNN
jgi:hypothetical protein